MSEQLSSMNSRQQSGRFEVTFVLPTELNAAVGVQPWLLLLGDDLPVLTAPSAGDDDAEPARHWVALVLRLARLLLQALRLPVFEVPQVLFCRAAVDAGGRYKTGFILSAPAHLSHNVCSDVLKSAFGLAKWTCTADATNSKDRKHFYEVIQRSVLQPHASVISKRKSMLEVLRVAHRKGIPYCLVAGDVYQLGWGYRLKKMDGSSTDRDTVTGLQWSHNKFLTAEVLSAAGLPTPKHHLVQTASAARNAAQKIGYPVVVKPVDLERGEGVAVDVGADTLNEAFDDAYKRSPRKQVLVELQVVGVCHRLFVCAGRLLYAVRRLPIGVYADGQRTIAELVNTACEQQDMLPPWKRSRIKPLDDLAKMILRQQGWTDNSVPTASQFVALRRIETTAWGGVDEEVTHTLHPENLRIALAAADIFGLEVAGIDIISPDITQPWFANGAVINEINFAPLLGGGEISLRYIGEYLDRLVPNKGRPEVVVFVGGVAAWQAAETYWQSKRQAGVAAFMTSASQTLDAQGDTLHLARQGLDARLRALILKREVQALVVVVQTLELLTTKPLLDRVDAVHVVDDEIWVDAQSMKRASAPQVSVLVEYCKKWSDKL